MTIQEAQQLRYGAQQVKVYPDWIGVENKLPERWQVVLANRRLTSTDGHAIMVYAFDGVNFISADNFLPAPNITHWMPLPKGPDF